MKTIDEQITELKQLTRTAKITDLSKALGVSPSTVRTWRSREKIPENIFLKAEEMAQERDGFGTPKGYMTLDFYDVEVSAGHGALVEREEKSTEIVFSEEFISKSIGVNPNEVFLMPVRGDSMAPTLKNQALVMVHKVDEFSGDGVYVFRFDGQLMVKRLQFMPKVIKVVSDNHTYENWELLKDDLKNEDFQIIGEVVWSGQRM
ncbi:Peptidase S24/S26A/S26B/S26C domain-containing protein [Vibrio crassostreae]|uniref:S24 family peptidase n=2 Tax=Vibrio crassostreae TaxID=246167 RepID=UPI000631C11E|nr:S24 family peptidase [Vibrio crassostreae]CAK2041150.1 Peptidase S24/S26A/S26B/S26C domain-containing protein [Vibrio crassostreae]CAK2044482.1 Peptidase S24/S26A/S26B/S26C domain-containing protein [Vibrio crassostreae]CAK2352973.1 Peptidase S24/S26A/S26B/S26C domain-containing protein [Vibrio crassostreae]CAK2819266.1 Peptidase S24/S26A/S26B/S26C domain-containing protein [Vibrio crassostreae]CAK2886403.1 Peptidase S24/S26A/S26B/S26C domain-containing protein [Vibrio crassostreae]